MQLTASDLKDGKRFALAYHPDGDGYGAVNIFLNHLLGREVHLYSIDSPQRDFTEQQWERLQKDIANDFWVIYIDLSPSNPEQIQKILEKTRFFCIDHHQISPAFEAFFDQIPVNNPRIDSPANAQDFAAGLQVYQLFGEEEKDIPFLHISMFGDAKFTCWPFLQEQLKEYQYDLDQMAQAISRVGLTQPIGSYNPERTDALFNETFELTRAAYQKGGVAGLLQSFKETQIFKQSQSLQEKLKQGYQSVQKNITEQNRAIEIEDDQYKLSAILLKEAYFKLDFEGHYVLYQIDQQTQTVLYALMSKKTDYDCAASIRNCPYVKGGGHTDRAGCTGSAAELQQTLAFFQVN